jgi:hypothetical protein
MEIPDFDKIENIIQVWAKSNHRINKAYLFGSYQDFGAVKVGN